MYRVGRENGARERRHIVLLEKTGQQGHGDVREARDGDRKYLEDKPWMKVYRVLNLS